MSLLSALTRTLHRLRPRLRPLVPGRGRRASRREISAFSAQIQADRGAFLRFGQASDLEFTALARGLSQLGRRLAELRTETGALDAVLQDRDEDRAISSAYALYKDSVDLVHANAGIAVSAQEQLTAVEAALGQTFGEQATFERDHLFLSIVTLGIRIEASRLPPEDQTVFLNVASAIAETGERIRACTTAAFGRIAAVIVESQATRAELHASEQALQRNARQSIDTIQRELEGLKAGLAPCAGHSRAIGELLAATQPQTLGVITALQHQDIVRQQLEHVSEGFQDIEEHFGAGPAAAIEWDYIDQAGRIQAAQLAAARSEIEGAGTAVTGGLEALLATSAAMVERFAAMESAAAAALDHSRVAEFFAAELQELNRIVERSQQANVRTGQLAERIEEVVRVFSAEIGRYELDVKIVALNAQIAAARLSSADALNRLAEETSQASEANARVTHALSSALQANLGKLETVRREGSAFLDIVTRERAKLEQGLATVGEKLGRLVQRVRSGAAKARQEFEPVHQECHALLAGLSFPGLIEDTFGPAAQLCRDLTALGASSAGTVAPSASALEKIKRHRDRYTMHKETATHATALGETAAGIAAGADSVELFDEPAAAPAAAVAPAPAAVAADTVASPPSDQQPLPSVAAAPAGAGPVGALPPSSQDLGDGIELF